MSASPTPLGIEASRPSRLRDFALAVFFGVVALGGIVVGSAFGNIHGETLHLKIVAWLSAGVIVVFGVMATRRTAVVAGRIVSSRTILSAGAAVRIIISIVGYLIALFATLGVLSVSITHLLVGGALTGVVVGIAAQQSLGNVFAGLVLLLARPFNVGDHIRVRAGALGGQFDGVVTGMSLTYVTMRSEGGPLKVPNSAMLAAAVGPYIPPPISEGR